VKRHLPFALTTLRLLLGPVALACSLGGVGGWVFVPLLLAGTLSDIFDGVLARRFGVATPALRRYDSITDVIYYLFILACLWLRCRPVVLDNVAAIAAILLSEVAVIVVCAVKFGKYPATHSWLAKFYGLCLLGALMALLAFAAGRWAVLGLMMVALITNLEIIVMHLLARQPPVDVKSIFCLRRPPAVSPATRSR
jgi:CDP-diacylglycerol--glycerol-3-phosphate 3-phosphatidyltransferase